VCALRDRVDAKETTVLKRFWGHVRTNAVGYVALFLALSGGTAFAVSRVVDRAKRADTVDGLSAAKFTQDDAAVVPDTVVMEVGDFKVKYACLAVSKDGKRGTSANLQLRAKSTVDNARATLDFITGSDPAGSAFHVTDTDLDAGEFFSLDQNRSFGGGTAVLSAGDGSAVSVEFGFNEGSSTCLAHGVALGG
jgi:hypothetical protein